MKRTNWRKKIVSMIPVLIGISFLTFALTYLAPGDPVTAMYAAGGSIPSEEVLERTREELGLNRPFLVQYVHWLANCLHGDFGTSYTYGKPVGELLAARLLPTLLLAFGSLCLMLLVAVPLGILAAVHQNGIVDYAVRIFSFLSVSLPNFWVGLILLYVCSVRLGWLPVVSGGQGVKGMILPCVTLAFAMTAKYTRQVRMAFLEELHQDYVVGARCRGIKESTIWRRHILPNAMLPLVTLLGLSLGSLLGGTAVVEIIFSYPGLGNLAVNAILAMDYHLIQGYVLWTALIYMALHILVDFSYELLDPRMRKEVDR